MLALMLVEYGYILVGLTDGKIPERWIISDREDYVALFRISLYRSE